ncbi:hypothetical protein HII13_000435 [Brettanomyces bruxellensis]|nr:hypothetical protein HII13_000435 [Brettanomyces bruxellensis]
MPQLQSQMQNSSPAAVSPALSPQASSLSPKIMNSARLNSVAQQIHVHKHTPSPEEIQEAMSQHRASRQELSADQSMSGICTPVLSSPPSLHASSASSPIPNTGQIMGQGTSNTNTNMPRNITDNDPNLSLEAIENDILNTDFSLLDDDGLNPN